MREIDGRIAFVSGGDIGRVIPVRPFWARTAGVICGTALMTDPICRMFYRNLI
jgi:hypothetical protein